MEQPILSWGRAHKYPHQVINISADTDLLNIMNDVSAERVIPRGLGRSYGDVALNEGHAVLNLQGLNYVKSIDWDKGIVEAYAGFSLQQLNELTIPRGWIVPVTPGTKFVTLGGMVANDVHGKNHHHAGSFGAHIQSLDILRSDGEIQTLSALQNPELFALTIGGLGLTGLILSVELKLKKISSAFLDVENIPYGNLEEFFKLSEESNAWEYSVAWIDCFASKNTLGRGIFTRANFRNDNDLDLSSGRKVTWPMETPGFLLNKFSISAFNLAYRARPGATYKGKMGFDSFFYPLDGVLEWNKLYGPKGFYQHQSILPKETADESSRALLETIAKSGQGSFLAVMKVHGEEKSPGKLSFCMEGVSLALDFSNKGKSTLELLHKLEKIVLEYGGRLYPAKDGTMSAETFQAGYPQWKELENARDPKVSSSFWRRVTKV